MERPTISLLPTWGFLVLVAVMILVLAAVMSGRNRRVLGALGALIGFGFVALVGVFLLLALSYGVARVEVAEAPATPETPHPVTEIEILKAEAEHAVPPNQTRPKWMDEPQGKHGGDGAYHKIVSVELYRSRAECEQAMPAELRKAVKEYIDLFLGEEGAAERVDLPMPDIRDHIIKAQWEEHTADVLGPIVNLHTLLVFDGKTNAEIKARDQRARVAGRLATTGVGAGLLLGLLGTVFGYLKLDTLTHGYYARRLQFAAGSAILGLAAIAALWARGKFGF
ncbi:MAG TPA: hypothetical protein VMV69_15400 [Pirellulales bacterium]|nr:hypothetical protein [Pirellulales bacterium]